MTNSPQLLCQFRFIPSENIVDMFNWFYSHLFGLLSSSSAVKTTSICPRPHCSIASLASYFAVSKPTFFDGSSSLSIVAELLPFLSLIWERQKDINLGCFPLFNNFWLVINFETFLVIFDSDLSESDQVFSSPQLIFLVCCNVLSVNSSFVWFPLFSASCFLYNRTLFGIVSFLISYNFSSSFE